MYQTKTGPDASALLVIDMVRDFILPGGTIAEAGGPEYQERARAMIPRLARLIAAARSAGVTVVYAPDAHRPGDAELRKWPPHAMAGTPEAEMVDELAPEEGDIVWGKRSYSPFVDPAFERLLEERGIERLYVTGLHTDCCARHTSGDAFQRGYDLVWVTDALEAFSEEAHRDGLAYFETWYATEPERQFRTVDELVEEWGRVPAAAGAERE